MRRLLLATCLWALVATTARAVEVKGRVTMPEVCAGGESGGGDARPGGDGRGGPPMQARA